MKTREERRERFDYTVSELIGAVRTNPSHTAFGDSEAKLTKLFDAEGPAAVAEYSKAGEVDAAMRLTESMEGRWQH